MVDFSTYKIAILVPCFNEQVTIAKVVNDFRHRLPSATIYVFDNDSTDASAEIARAQGAIVIREPRRGKGYVIESMLARVEADYYVMVDGDDTYPADQVEKLLEPVVSDRADMVVGVRMASYSEDSFRPLHVCGNRLVCSLVNAIGHSHLTDIMSGYRAFNRRIADGIPVVASGFEVETEMTIQSIYYRMKIAEVPVAYASRPAGSSSKLRTFHDGARVLWKIITLLRTLKPLTFFGGLGLFFLVLGLAAGVPPVLDYLNEPDHYVRHVPLAILAASLMTFSALFTFLGLLLHALNWRFIELHNIVTRRRPR
jgi:glycosyltransferase involved in cell wall biosynthesis